ncbi:hypothetical protein [Streptomyces sp. NPDC007100]|uniref:hypothetical protein n=1 Tax=Streptomyces sp. NPDC007100 TaxID=3155602 RepID=UPI003405C030
MKIALDPYMLRHVPPLELPAAGNHLAANGFDGTLVSSVFVREERGRESSRFTFTRERVDAYVSANRSR